MASVHEQVSERFHRWESRGRGWKVYDQPVYPEPPFTPFPGHFITQAVDDGRRPSFLGSLFGISRQTPPPVVVPDEEEPEPQSLIRDSLIELHTSLPADLDIKREAFEQFLRNLALCSQPISFELLGTSKGVTVQFAASVHDGQNVRRQLQAHFSDAVFQPRESTLEQVWDACDGDEIIIVEFGLAREFMLPLATGKLDPFIGLIGALSELQQSDLGLFQVLFQPTHQPWAESIVRSVSHEDGKPFFVNQPELTSAAENKVAQPLYAAVVRIAVKSETFDRALDLAKDMAGSLRAFAHPQGNELIPLKNEGYPFEEHIEDVLRRQSRRSGMLLNSEELIGFVHLPSSAVRSPVLQRDAGKSKKAPAIVQNATGLLLGNNIHFGESIPIRLTPEHRVYHSHIIGATGTGKSTLLFNLLRQDIENGEGLALLDPHGDLVDKILGIIPEERIDDVVLVDPSDEEFSVGFNILSAHSEHEKTLLASDLVSVFQRLSTSWGDQMQSVLQNAILAFLNSSRTGTLADLRRFLVEPSFRTEFLKSVSDPNILYYWQKGFSHLSGNKSIGPILTRLEMFLAQRPIAHMVSQPENRLDFGQIMDTGKIFLAKLPEGLLGRENSYLLGAVLVSKFQQLVMARQAKKIAARRDFWIYIDEFANFITPTMAEILSGARKYRIGLALAHHELHQLQRSPEVASAVMTHPFTRVVFRVGDDDAKKLADGFSSFEARDLKNLETGEAICRVQRSDFDFNLSIPFPEPVDETAATTRTQKVIALSRSKYSTPREEIEAMLRKAWDVADPKAATKDKAPKPFHVTREPTVTSPTTEIHKPSDILAPPPGDAAPIPTVKPNLPENESRTAKQPQSIEIQPAPVVSQAPVPRDLGRGGEQHKSIQERLQREAHALGFFAEVESQLKGSSMEAADLVLKRGDKTIAVEIAVTTTIDHEFGNVKKCLEAGFPRVAVISSSQERLKQIQEAVHGGLDSASSIKVGYFTPDDFISELQKLAAEMPTQPPSPNESVRRGFKVRKHGPTLMQEERKQKEHAAHQILSEVMKQGL